MSDTTSQQVHENVMAMLQGIRRQVSACLKRAGDALFNLTDAVLSESQAQSLPKLSLSAFFERKETHRTPEAISVEQDAKGKFVRTSRFSHLHFKEDRELSLKVIRVERESAKETKRDPRVSWFVMLDDILPLKDVASHYGLRFSQEHCYRFLKHDLPCLGRSRTQCRMTVTPDSIVATHVFQ